MNTKRQSLEHDLELVEQDWERFVEGARRVRYHLTECEHSDFETIRAFDELMKALGIQGRITEQPKAEMAVVEG